MLVLLVKQRGSAQVLGTVPAVRESVDLPAAITAALADARDAVFEYDDACDWFAARAATFREPLAVEVWVLDPSLSHVLLVEHRWRGWVPPGGAAEPGERPAEAAERELAEETGLEIQLLDRPAAVTVRSYHPDWSATLGLSYAAIADPSSVRLSAEVGQPAAWTPLSSAWTSVFPDDRRRIAAYATWLGAQGPRP